MHLPSSTHRRVSLGTRQTPATGRASATQRKARFRDVENNSKATDDYYTLLNVTRNASGRYLLPFSAPEADSSPFVLYWHWADSS